MSHPPLPRPRSHHFRCPTLHPPATRSPAPLSLPRSLHPHHVQGRSTPATSKSPHLDRHVKGRTPLSTSKVGSPSCHVQGQPATSKIASPPPCPMSHSPATFKVASPPSCPSSRPSCHVQGRLTPFIPRLPPPLPPCHDKGRLTSVKSKVTHPCHVQGHLCHVECRPCSHVQGRPTHPMSKVSSVDSSLTCPTSPPT